MRVSSAALRVFLLGCVASEYGVDAGFRPPFLQRIPLLNGQNQKLRHPRTSVVSLKEKTGNYFWDLFKFDSSPDLRRALGLENGGPKTPHPPEEAPPAEKAAPFFSQDTGRQLPNWSPPPPPPDISIPYDAAAKLAYEASDQRMPYEAFKAKYEAAAVADVIAKNKGSVESKKEEKKPNPPSETLKPLAEKVTPKEPIIDKRKTEEIRKATKVVVEKVVVSFMCLRRVLNDPGIGVDYPPEEDSNNSQEDVGFSREKLCRNLLVWFVNDCDQCSVELAKTTPDQKSSFLSF
jgi:hypothetical protein